MNAPKFISSPQNALIRQVMLLQEKSRERKKQGLFGLEGRRELALALKADYELESVMYDPGIISKEDTLALLKESSNQPELIEVSHGVYKKLAYRDSTEGLIAVLKTKTHTLEGLALKDENALVLVAESPEKPGNIGALLRTADAANVDAVLIANPKGDLYNPNVIRSSIGCVFTSCIGIGSTAEIITFLKEHRIQIYCAALSASKEYTQTDFTKASAIVVGTESTGLSQEWLEASTQNIIIPMEGEIDSMNVSVSAAILIFEAKRQRSA
ncbi:MAG: RNA methyltransferase [Maribacter sp.]|uniref:TrmH family RNA methyltransferase n=1 Tax=Maribacter sp. TaxID=1897614 RepID=UPI003C710300